MKKYLTLFIILLLVGCSNDKAATDNAVKADVSNQFFEPLQAQEEDASLSGEYAYYIDSYTSQVLPKEDADPEIVLLTFDDAPDTYALQIAKTLKENNAPAIFFVNGMFLEEDGGKEMLKEIYDMGFEIGNHTQTHPSLDSLNDEETEYEMKETNRLVEEVIGKKPRFFRAPFGINTEKSLEIAEEEGMTVMNWTFGYDWEPEYQEKDALADIMVNNEFLADGANLLMHDREWTNAALPEILSGLQEKGFSFVDPKNIE